MPAALEMDKIRADFPILNREVKGKPLVYLDSGATSQKPRARRVEPNKAGRSGRRRQSTSSQPHRARPRSRLINRERPKWVDSPS